MTSLVICFQEYHFHWTEDPCLTQMLMQIIALYPVVIALDDHVFFAQGA